MGVCGNYAKHDWTCALRPREPGSLPIKIRYFVEIFRELEYRIHPLSAGIENEIPPERYRQQIICGNAR